MKKIKTYIVSYPRSGNTWLRYCIEFISGKPTNGLIGKRNNKDHLQLPLIHVMEDDFIAHKLHTWDNNKITGDDNVILLVRNYKECIIRHNEGPRGYGFELFKDHVKGNKGDYVGILKSFDRFNGNKIMIYYEDLMDKDKLRNELYKLVYFFDMDYDISSTRIDDLMKSYRTHKVKCLNIYPNSQSKGNDLNFHSKKLSLGERIEWDAHIQNKHPELYNKYLERYEENGHN